MQNELNERRVNLKAIVDSGADNTMLPIAVLERLQAHKAETVWMSGVTGNRIPVDLYWAFVQIGSLQPVYTEVIGTKNRKEIIIGRDIINQFAVLLNGPAHILEIS